jgi:hypothetical protein
VELVGVWNMLEEWWRNKMEKRLEWWNKYGLNKLWKVVKFKE